MRFKKIKLRRLEFIRQKRINWTSKQLPLFKDVSLTEYFLNYFEKQSNKLEFLLNYFQKLFKKILGFIIPRPLPGYSPVKLIAVSWSEKLKNSNSPSIGIFVPYYFLYRDESPLFYFSIFQTLFPKTTNKVHQMHCRQIIQWRKTQKLYYLIFTFPIFLILYTGVMFELNPMEYHDVFQVQNFVLFCFLFITLVLLMVVPIRISHKIANAMSLKPFADSICALTCSYIVIALSRDDILLDSQKQTQLINTMDVLAHNTLSLARRFSSQSDSEQKWSVEHFRHIERYIRERERWTIAPMESTLDDLRNDFYELANIYFYGNYGSFDWSKIKDPLPPPVTRLGQEAFNILARFISIFLPIVLFVLLFWQKHQAEYMGISINIVALILISWFLLAVDAALKLGIISGAVNLAKEIRSLK